MNIYVETYGCTANKADERVLIGLLKQEKHRIVDTIQDADVLVLLTCTVIGTTEQRMLSRLKIFQNTHKKIIVAGCMPAVQPDLIQAIVPQADLLVPNSLQYIINIMSGKKLTGAEGKKTRFPKDFHGVIAPLSIAQGCLSACSYCITQVARGKLKSVPTEDILGDVTSALNQGCKEIQLTAQDTASYGLDITTNLGELLQHVCKIQGTFRVRVGMMNPATLQKNLTSILNAYHHPTMYQFLHLPVQSGDDIILNKMNREYTTKGYTTIINKFRTSIPQLTLATDVIVGFPTETEEQHQNTMTFLQTIQPDIINITRFSARPHTKAKTMNGRIPTHIVKQRSQEITKLSYAISLQKNKKHLGNNYTILVTEHGKQQTVTGRTPHYKQVVIKEPVTIGDFVDVTITDATATYLVGKLK